jgi:Icc-related predicted phosphoesterase
MAKLKICAMSDLHGTLPFTEEIGKVDVVVLCGDTVPMAYQRSGKLSNLWLRDEFKSWIDGLDCDRVIMIAGNHDFYFSYEDKTFIKDLFKELCGEKLVYLQDESYEYKGVKFYGCPWCKGPLKWAFCPNDINRDITRYYEMIEDCDVLLTHQPASLFNIGISYYWTEKPQDWSSKALLDAIAKKDILVNFCGHIHSGDHQRATYVSGNHSTVFYNVSLMGETYNWDYQPRFVEVDTKNKTVLEIQKS